jgi:hypothetical protein
VISFLIVFFVWLVLVRVPYVDWRDMRREDQARIDRALHLSGRSPARAAAVPRHLYRGGAA